MRLGVIALLLAPKSGSELRADIRRKAREAADDLGESMGEIGEKAAAVIAQGKRQAEALRAQAEAKLAEARARAEELVAEGREKVRDLVEEREKLAHAGARRGEGGRRGHHEDGGERDA